MKFLVCEKQSGEGCDYYIGCGMKYSLIEADSIEDAQEQAIYPDGRNEWCALEGEQARCQIWIVPADNMHVVDIKSIKAEIKAQKAKEKELATKLAEEQEFERLKKKLGK